ncbi:MAG: D-glycero-beta-D-manno-heptose 1-phosphate adenylyltransferase [Candidatus Makaraimicrobium thalassicum]|nr:MAG: D-glycero-beta-D-manno-heptose 1-phosphate adenylyltransferase [Candidatus Omnitrophota bacterium]
MLFDMITEKIKTQAELADIVKKERIFGKIIGFTNGCFDILHLGHVRYLNDAKKECDLLITAVNSDKSVRRLKGKQRPVNAQRARLEVLAAVECVDFLTLFDDDTPEALIKDLGPDILFKGGDWNEKDVVGSGHVKARGGKVRVLPYVAGYSTTDLIKRIKTVSEV